MGITPKRQLNARATLLAARSLSRRSLLARRRRLAHADAGALSDDRRLWQVVGELNILAWADELPDPILPDFTNETGIKVNMTPFSQNEEQINKLQTTAGAGFDLCMPTRDRSPQFRISAC